MRPTHPQKDAGWRIAAGWAKDQTAGLTFSRSVLSRVVEQGRTFFGTPQSGNARASLENVEAVVGSPIFGSSGTVVGVVYGSRDWAPKMSRVGIQPLEAQVVQLLASSVSVGLIRMEMQQRLQQAIAQSITLDPGDWHRRPWPQRMASWLAYGAVRLMLGLAGFGRWV